MHQILLAILAALLVLELYLATRYTLTSAAPPPPTPSVPVIAIDHSWELIFSDEFDGTEVNADKWITMFPWGRNGANPSELQYYAEDAFEFLEGIHRIKAEQRSMAGYDYTSGIITSAGKFSMTYGYMEVRAKMPHGQGFWPAVWLLPEDEDWPPEIDVLEILGHETNTVYMTNHWLTEANEHVFAQGQLVGPDFAEDFHIFAVEWSPAEIIWFIDGVERFRTNQGVPAEPMYLLINLAVGGEWPGNPDETTPFPGYMDLDYVRVYRHSTSQQLPNHIWLPFIQSHSD